MTDTHRLRIVHSRSGQETEQELVSLLPRTVCVTWEPGTKVFARATGKEWGLGDGWCLDASALALLANMPPRWRRPSMRKPRAGNPQQGPWLPAGSNITDMPIAQLRALGYLDEETLEQDDDGTWDFDFSELAWDNFTQADFDRMGSAVRNDSDDK